MGGAHCASRLHWSVSSGILTQVVLKDNAPYASIHNVAHLHYPLTCDRHFEAPAFRYTSRTVRVRAERIVNVQ